MLKFKRKFRRLKVNHSCVGRVPGHSNGHLKLHLGIALTLTVSRFGWRRRLKHKKCRAEKAHDTYIIFICIVCYFCCLLFLFVCYFCVVLCIVCFVSFYVLFVCKCVLYYSHRVATQLQLNISHHTIFLFYYFLVGGGAYYGWVALWVLNPEWHSRMLKSCGAHTTVDNPYNETSCLRRSSVCGRGSGDTATLILNLSTRWRW